MEEVAKSRVEELLQSSSSATESLTTDPAKDRNWFLCSQENSELEKGRIVECGSHRELLDLGGTYKRLYDLQFRV